MVVRTEILSCSTGHRPLRDFCPTHIEEGFYDLLRSSRSSEAFPAPSGEFGGGGGGGVGYANGGTDVPIEKLSEFLSSQDI